ncbi:VOC family protein [Breoghania sp. L-A4]|uniref:VOC family protein n=1 Tax=Breoghania sp. L-A4 TaxID=2304600 RepID=UPI0013C2FE5B|nr:VOC family protein [Breoghania sp. L-A4]
MRQLDHLVIAVRDLDAAGDAYAALGFTLTPRADHAWGTSNRLVQLDGAFLEVLAVADPSRMEEADVDAFSFGAYNRDFLTRHEGISMLVLDSSDPVADRKGFHDRGMTVYAPFSFERDAGQPGGGSRTVGFDLTFTTDPDMPDAAFFTCRNRYPENFWRSEFQQHANGARKLGAAIIVAEEPSDVYEFVEGFSGQRELGLTSFGMECALANGGSIDVLTPTGFKAFYGEAFAVEALETPRLVAAKVLVDDVAKIARIVAENEIPAIHRSGMVIVPAAANFGTALIFQQLD